MAAIYKFLKHNLSRIPRFFVQWRLYGFPVAFGTLLYPFSRLFGTFEPCIAVKKHSPILKYLYKHYSNIIDEYKNLNSPPLAAISPGSTIWVCWWDGEQAMPKLVKACYNSIRQYAGDHHVQLITKHNYGDFISIPGYILEKVEKKIITLTHFSNILRANLLYDHGGIWMDATILVLQNISLENLPFYTLKAPALKSKSISLYRFAGLSDVSSKCLNKESLQISRWSGFLLAGPKNTPVFGYMRDILYAYWKDHNDQIDYLLFDYTIALGYDNIPAMKMLVDNVPCSSAEKFVMENNMNTVYSNEAFAEYYKTPFHKLTWKKHFYPYIHNHKRTVYGYVLDTFYEQKK